MNHFPLDQIHTCADKQPLASVAGTLTRLYKRQSGTRSHDGSEWTKQDFELKSSNGSIIKVNVWDHPEIPKNFQGKPVELLAKEGPKGVTGLYIHDDDYKGNITRKLKLSATGIIQLVGGSSVASESPAAQNPSNDWPNEEEIVRQAQGSNQIPPPTQSQKKKEPNPIHETKADLMKLTNLHLLATAAVEKYLAPEYKKITGREMPEDRRGASVSSLIIAGERRGLQLNLPARPLREDEI